jgi:hypothetical protein
MPIVKSLASRDTDTHSASISSAKINIQPPGHTRDICARRLKAEDAYDPPPNQGAGRSEMPGSLLMTLRYDVMR